MTATGPAPLAELVPETVAGMAARAARADYPRWAAQVAGCGYCARPVRLVGRTETRDADGRVLSAYSTPAPAR